MTKLKLKFKIEKQRNKLYEKQKRVRQKKRLYNNCKVFISNIKEVILLKEKCT